MESKAAKNRLLLPLMPLPLLRVDEDQLDDLECQLPGLLENNQDDTPFSLSFGMVMRSRAYGLYK